jgi:hypothetical protein
MKIKNAFVSYELTSIICPKCDGNDYFEKQGFRKIFLCKKCDQSMKLEVEKFRFSVLSWLIFAVLFFPLFGLIVSPLLFLLFV